MLSNISMPIWGQIGDSKTFIFPHQKPLEIIKPMPLTIEYFTDFTKLKVPNDFDPTKITKNYPVPLETGIGSD